MEGHHHQQQQQHQLHLQQQQHQQQNYSVNIEAATVDRFPQWSVQETKEFLMIRAEFDRSFMETKRNKLLWEVISTKMKEQGYNRSADQCKCKWKNLVTRYKGYETMEPEATRQQFPFYSELQGIFAARMQRMLWAEAEGGMSSSKKKASSQLTSDDEDDDVTEFSEGEKGADGSRKKKKKKLKISNTNSGSSSGSSSSYLVKLLEEFMKQQLQMEIQWREAFEAREKERRMKEMEWRQTMEALENERVMMERKWREREEQRRMKEEARAEKRDALITALLNKLRREDM